MNETETYLMIRLFRLTKAGVESDDRNKKIFLTPKFGENKCLFLSLNLPCPPCLSIIPFIQWLEVCHHFI
jgi:hypothetical protein